MTLGQKSAMVPHQVEDQLAYERLCYEPQNKQGFGYNRGII